MAASGENDGWAKYNIWGAVWRPANFIVSIFEREFLLESIIAHIMGEGDLYDMFMCSGKEKA
jgi:hypothetical protein